MPTQTLQKRNERKWSSLWNRIHQLCCVWQVPNPLRPVDPNRFTGESCCLHLSCCSLLQFPALFSKQSHWTIHMRRRVSRLARGSSEQRRKSVSVRYTNIHLGPQLADPELSKLCRHILSGGKLPPQGQSGVHGLCFTKMKDLPRAVNPGPGWYPPDLESDTKPAGEHNCLRGVPRGVQAAHEPRIRAKQTGALPGLMECGEVSITWKRNVKATSQSGSDKHKGHWIR